MACAINLGSSVVVTGGHNYPSTVSEYNEAGYVRDLPSLRQEKYSQGCSYYNNDDGTKVSFRY